MGFANCGPCWARIAEPSDLVENFVRSNRQNQITLSNEIENVNLEPRDPSDWVMMLQAFEPISHFKKWTRLGSDHQTSDLVGKFRSLEPTESKNSSNEIENVNPTLLEPGTLRPGLNQSLILKKWTLLGSNQRPSDYESDALTG